MVDAHVGALGTTGAPSLSLGTTSGRETLVLAALCSQADTPVLTGTGVLTADLFHDYGNEIALWGTGTGETDGSTAVGFDAANADAQGWALSAVALRSDALILARAISQALADGGALTDAQAFGRGQGLADQAGITDTITPAAAVLAGLADTASVADAASPAAVLVRVTNDGLVAADATSPAAVLARAVADGLVIADVATPTTDTPPTTEVTATTLRLSRVAGKDTTDLTITTNEPFVEYQVRIVPAADSAVTAGSLVEQATVSSRTEHTATITDDEIVDAAGSGTFILKAFTRDAAGNWSS